MQLANWTNRIVVKITLLFITPYTHERQDSIRSRERKKDSMNQMPLISELGTQ